MLSQVVEMRENREEGFTLIELLVVILIVGILAAITVPAFMNQRKSSVDSSVKSDVANTAQVIDNWILKNPSKYVPNGSITYNAGGTPTITGDIANSGMTGFKVSENTTITVTGSISTRGTFTLKGENDKGDKSLPATGIIYDSKAGGMQQ